VTKREVKIPHDRYATSAHVYQLTTPRLKVPTMTTKVSYTSRGFTGSLAIRRESVSPYRPNYQRTERGSEELNISAKLE
jgi:hypothetical protein